MNEPTKMAACLPDVIDEGILNCSLCSRQLRDPRILPCLHLFCLSCIQDYVAATANRTNTQHSNSIDAADYLTFPDTPKVPTHGDEKNLKRSSTASDESLKKRFQQPERYTNHDALAQRAHLYRNKYRMSKTKYHNREKPQLGQKQSHTTTTPTPRPQTQATDASSTSKKLTIRLEEAKQVRKPFTRAQSSPQRLVRSPTEEKELASRGGQVSNMVNMYERRTSDAGASRISAPPLASFRPKAKPSATSVTNQQKFVPLSERPLPQINPPIPSRSCFTGVLQPATTNRVLLKSVSLTKQESYDSALGTGESDKQLVFVDNLSPTALRQTSRSGLERIVSVTEDNVYESFEVPDCRSTKTNRDMNSGLPAQMRSSSARKPSASERRSKFASQDASENIYYSISELHVQTAQRLKRGTSSFGSVPDLLAEIPDSSATIIQRKNETEQPKRRNSTILDSYIMASDFINNAKAKDSNDLNNVIPLSCDDNQRLSNLYMRMDGAKQRLPSQINYVAMGGLTSPSGRNSTSLPPENVQSLIRSISEEFHNQTSKTESIASGKASIDDNVFTFDPVPEMSPPIYENNSNIGHKQADSTDHDFDIDIDQPIPLYETADKRSNTVSYYNAEDADKTKPEPLPKVPSHPCPTCHRSFTLKDSDASTLPTCSFASQMAEVVLTQKCEKKRCGHCEHKDAQYMCLDCQLYLCPGCHQGHAWVRTQKNHRVTTLQELQSGKYQKQIKQLQITECDIAECHREARHFCADCDQLLCSECLTQHSRTHQSSMIDAVAAREQDFIASITQTLQSRREIFDGATHNLETYQAHCRNAQDAILEEIQAHQDHTRQILDNCFDVVRSKVKSDYESEINATEQLKSNVQNTLSAISYITKFVKQLTDHGNPASMVAMGSSVKQEISRLQQETPKVMQTQMHVTFSGAEPPLDIMQQLCGDVSVDYVQLAPVKNNSRQEPSKELTERHSHKMELVTQFSTKLDEDAKGCRPNGVTITHDNLLVVVDDINKKLKAFDAQGILQFVINPQGDDALQDPWDICALADGNLAVTDKVCKRVKVFNRDGVMVHSFGDHLKKPWGISTNTRNGIIVTDVELKKVFIHDSRGMLLNVLPRKSHSSNSGQDDCSTLFSLKCPEYVTCNKFDDIIVSDFENHRIYAFDCLGRQLFKFGKKGKGVDEFHYPLGVGTDDKGNIFVVNYQNHRITVISRNGQFLCCLTSKEHLHSLQTLVVSPWGHLAAVDGSLIKLFRLPHTFSGASDQQHAVPEKRYMVLKSESSDYQDRRKSGVDRETTV